MKGFLEFEQMEDSVKESFYQGRHRSAAWHADGGGNDERHDLDNHHFSKPASKAADHPHAVHINGKKWKTFGSQSHATNVAKKIKGATVHKEEVELDEAKIDKEHPIVKEYDALKKHDIKHLRGLVKSQHKIVDTSEFKTKDHAISHYLRAKHGNTKVDQAFGFNKEEVELQEGADQHKVIVTVSDPNHTAVSQRKEQIMKRVIVKAKDKDEAHAKASAFYKNKGYKVHSTEYHSPQPKASMKTEEADTTAKE